VGDVDHGAPCGIGVECWRLAGGPGVGIALVEDSAGIGGQCHHALLASGVLGLDEGDIKSNGIVFSSVRKTLGSALQLLEAFREGIATSLPVGAGFLLGAQTVEVT